MASALSDSLRRFRFAEPFQPFELVLKDGRHLKVEAPEGVAWHAEDNVLSYAAPDDSFEHLALSDVQEVRSLGQGAAA